MKRNIIISIVTGALALCNVSASAAPASGCPCWMMNPDGEMVEVVAVGDEYSRHYVYASTGLPVEWIPVVEGRRPASHNVEVMHPGVEGRHPGVEGRRPASHNMKVTRPASHYATILAAAPQSGKFLVILIDFPDRPFVTFNPHAAFQELMNGDAMPVRGSYASARRYFEEQSSGAFIPDFEVVGPVTMSHNASYYASVGIDDSPTGMVVQEACQQLEEQLDFTEYDLDDDGVCDNIYLFYAGKGQADGGGTSTIWPHSARLDADWGIELDVDGVRISNYACSAELNGSGQFSGIGTFCHEFCHVLGLPDLYYGGVAHPQYFSLMASGNYNGNGFCPPNLSAYERYALGWLEPEEILNSEWITMEPMPIEADARLVKTTSENEYFILENRQKEGWDKYLPGHGLLIWHIDFDQQAWDDNIPNADKNHQRVFLVRANNNLSGYPNAASPFPGTAGVDCFDASTTPAFVDWSGNPVDCALSTISETASGNITFRADTSRAGIQEVEIDEATTYPTILPDGVYTLDGRMLAPENLAPGLYIRVTNGQAVKFAN